VMEKDLAELRPKNVMSFVTAQRRPKLGSEQPDPPSGLIDWYFSSWRTDGC